jgi:hypothetical protein
MFMIGACIANIKRMGTTISGLLLPAAAAAAAAA